MADLGVACMADSSRDPVSWRLNLSVWLIEAVWRHEGSPFDHSSRTRFAGRLNSGARPARRGDAYLSTLQCTSSLSQFLGCDASASVRLPKLQWQILVSTALRVGTPHCRGRGWFSLPNASLLSWAKGFGGNGRYSCRASHLAARSLVALRSAAADRRRGPRSARLTTRSSGLLHSARRRLNLIAAAAA